MSEVPCKEVKPIKPGVTIGRDVAAEEREVIGQWEAYAEGLLRALERTEKALADARELAARYLRCLKDVLQTIHDQAEIIEGYEARR